MKGDFDSHDPRLTSKERRRIRRKKLRRDFEKLARVADRLPTTFLSGKP